MRNVSFWMKKPNTHFFAARIVAVVFVCFFFSRMRFERKVFRFIYFQRADFQWLLIFFFILFLFRIYIFVFFRFYWIWCKTIIYLCSGGCPTIQWFLRTYNEHVQQPSKNVNFPKWIENAAKEKIAFVRARRERANWTHLADDTDVVVATATAIVVIVGTGQID